MSLAEGGPRPATGFTSIQVNTQRGPPESRKFFRTTFEVKNDINLVATKRKKNPNWDS